MELKDWWVVGRWGAQRVEDSPAAGVQTEPHHESVEVIRNGCFEIEIDGSVQLEPPCVESLAPMQRTRRVAIPLLPDERVPEVACVDADLMRSAGLDHHGQDTRVRPASEYTHPG